MEEVMYKKLDISKIRDGSLIDIPYLSGYLKNKVMEEEKKLCTPQHSINGHVPLPNEFQYDKAVCDCKKIMWIKVNTCGCPAATATYELQARPNQ